jgi:starch synthase (maltosyl-transferring)
VNTSNPDARDPEPLRRVVVEDVRPAIEGGPVKRTVGELLEVSADVFADGHDVVHASLLVLAPGAERWREVPMEDLGNDRWSGTFTVAELGTWHYAVRGWVDRFATWQRDTRRKVEAGLDVAVELLEGAAMVEQAATRAPDQAARTLRAVAVGFRQADTSVLEDDDPGLATAMARLADRSAASTSAPLALLADRETARFSAWYELFPRSFGKKGEHGTLADVEAVLPYVAGMGFDVLYLPPIHPIGTTNRKGRNNSLTPKAGEVGSPWAIGSPEGGHDAVHPQLGTDADVASLVAAARSHGVDLALDLALQCSPDHPWVTEHPEWFVHRADGSIQHAENPPKKYEDIYPLDLETGRDTGLWDAVLHVVLHWAELGVRTFRVDNPHTKPLELWRWLLAEVRARHPETIFLSEAFTRPRVMERLAKVGFDQSYTYFTWREEAWELREWFTELTQTDLVEYLRPNVWPNTPDILPEHLQEGGPAMFRVRAILAATLAASYGIYGPAFELGEHRPREQDSEEYLDSEKYQLRRWNMRSKQSLAPLLTRLNAARKAHPALQHDRWLHFHEVEGDDLLCYSKRSPDGDDVVLCVVTTQGREPRTGLVHLDLEQLGVAEDEPFEVHDLLSDKRFTWKGRTSYVALDPTDVPGHLFVVTGGTA